jgi:hypothetical protein
MTIERSIAAEVPAATSSATSAASTTGQAAMGASPAGAIAQTASSIIGDIINLGLAGQAAMEQKLETQNLNAQAGADLANEKNLEAERYGYSKHRSEMTDAYNKLFSDRKMLDSFAGDLQNYLNRDQQNATRLVTLWRRAA